MLDLLRLQPHQQEAEPVGRPVPGSHASASKDLPVKLASLKPSLETVQSGSDIPSTPNLGSSRDLYSTAAESVTPPGSDEAPHTDRQPNYDHWPTPTPAAWRETVRDVGQVAAVLEWLSGSVQQSKINAHIKAATASAGCAKAVASIQQHVDLRNLLMRLLHDLLLGHIPDSLLDMTPVFETAFGVVMQGWVACDAEGSTVLFSELHELEQQSGYRCLLNQQPASALGCAFLERLAVDRPVSCKLLSNPSVAHEEP